MATSRRDEPTLRTRWLISVALLLHFGVLLFQLSANVAPSYLQGKIDDWLAPLLVTLNLDYGATPLELTHAAPIDFPLLVELLPADAAHDAPQAWQTLELPNATLSSNDTWDFRRSRWPNYARLIRLVAVEYPDSELLADIALPFVHYAESRSRNQFSALRIRAPKVLSYEEEEARASGYEELEGQEARGTVVFGATIVRTSSSIVLVPFQEPARTAKPAVVASTPSGVAP